MVARTNRLLALVALTLWVGLTSATSLAGVDVKARSTTHQALFPEQRFDAAIPTQEEVTGVAPGERPIRHDEMMRYMRALAAASPRAELRPYAESHEGRELVYLAVSDPSTIARLDDFQRDHAARVDPRGAGGANGANGFDSAKAVAWIAHSIHGDEISGADAAASLAYTLVAGEGGLAERLRKELVILIDPMENPDGRDRYLAMLRSFAHTTPSYDREDLSHTAVWPWGRGNHYLFDLNRDWFTMVHPESTRSAVIASWNPQLMVDAHEMGANDSYLFSPARHPFNPHLPDSHDKWGDTFGNEQAQELDSRGYGYYTREWNEEFFPGYGSSWASYRGAIGILYEMSRTTGQGVKKDDGSIRTYPQAVEHQYASAIANLRTLADHRSEILKDFVADRKRAMAEAAGQIAGYVLPLGQHPSRTVALLELLGKQGIEVHRLKGAVGEWKGARDIRTGKPMTKEQGDAEEMWWIPLDQPAAPLIRVLLDPHVPMEQNFLREQREYIERLKGSRLYDTTAWSLPLLFGVEAFWTDGAPPVGVEKAKPKHETGAFIAGSKKPYGWLMRGTSDASVEALAHMLQRELVVEVADRPFALDGEEYERGTLLVPREGNPDDVAEQLREIWERTGVSVVAAETAKVSKGGDLGGGHFVTLLQPKIGVFTGWPVSTTSYGALWYQLDKMEARFSALDVGRFGGVDLARYNVLVFPDSFGGAGSYAAVLGEGGVEQLKNWIRGGGTAVGIGAGAEFLADKKNEITRTRLRRQALDLYPPLVWGTSATEAENGGLFRAIGWRAEPSADDEGETSDTQSKKSKKAAAKPIKRESPYDIAPVIGAGAKPFVKGVSLGTPAGGTPLPLAKWLEPVLPQGVSAANEEMIAAADARLRRFRPEGALVRLELDPEQWLAWGLGDELTALVAEGDTLVAEPPIHVPARFAAADEIHLGGLLWPEAAGRLAHTAYTTREGSGRGQVILFLNEPEFRGWTYDTRRLLFNAIFLGPGLGTNWSSPW